MGSVGSGWVGEKTVQIGREKLKEEGDESVCV